MHNQDVRQTIRRAKTEDDRAVQEKLLRNPPAHMLRWVESDCESLQASESHQHRTERSPTMPLSEKPVLLLLSFLALGACEEKAPKVPVAKTSVKTVEDTAQPVAAAQPASPTVPEETLEERKRRDDAACAALPSEDEVNAVCGTSLKPLIALAALSDEAAKKHLMHPDEPVEPDRCIRSYIEPGQYQRARPSEVAMVPITDGFVETRVLDWPESADKALKVLNGAMRDDGSASSAFGGLGDKAFRRGTFSDPAKYRVMFARGRYVVELETGNKAPCTTEQLTTLAQMVDKRITAIE